MMRGLSTLLIIGTLALGPTVPVNAQTSSPGSTQNDAQRGSTLAPREGTTPQGATQGQTQSSQSGSATSANEDIPRMHFQQARQAFLNKDNNAAASHLEQAAQYIRGEMNRASGDARDELAGSAKELEERATELRQGEIKDVSTLNETFADSYSALAKHFHKLAQTEWNQNKERASAQTPEGQQVRSRVGRDLDRAADNLRNWSETTGQKAEEGGHTVWQSTKNIAGKLVSGTGWATSEVGEAIDNFGNTIQRFGGKMRPGQGATTQSGASQSPSSGSGGTAQ